MKEKLNKIDNGYVLLVDNIIYATDNDKLSKQNCDEIFGVVDVEKLDRKIRGLMMISGTSNGTIDHPNTDKMISLFNKAMELNKDKVFTLEDMQNAFYNGWLYKSENYQYPKALKEYLQHLQQPTEIEVEIMMESSKFIVDKSQRDDVRNGFNYRPKLDSENCLILRKI
jgi:hypothetical protein